MARDPQTYRGARRAKAKGNEWRDLPVAITAKKVVVGQKDGRDVTEVRRQRVVG